MRPALFLPALTLALWPALAPAGQDDAPMTAAEFDAYVTGKTLTYSQYGSVFGIEEYLPGRKVRWKFSEDECQYGSWYPKDEMICFTYEYDASEHCWTFWHKGEGLVALSVNDAPGAELNEVAQTGQGLNCPGPDVGV
ncbi:hypothetical protein [Xinfangfangia pollutisoli]|uniref:hypothetical protein n=1 Tax=Xinfangfangia pollutisoli TaxID=2865960 RepID=UPI001CD6C22A|nr:hypothetical protein [Xinfangfangia pollutisoli]